MVSPPVELVLSKLTYQRASAMRDLKVITKNRVRLQAELEAVLASRRPYHDRVRDRIDVLGSMIECCDIQMERIVGHCIDHMADEMSLVRLGEGDMLHLRIGRSVRHSRDDLDLLVETRRESWNGRRMKGSAT